MDAESGWCRGSVLREGKWMNVLEIQSEEVVRLECEVCLLVSPRHFCAFSLLFFPHLALSKLPDTLFWAMCRGGQFVANIERRILLLGITSEEEIYLSSLLTEPALHKSCMRNSGCFKDTYSIPPFPLSFP